VRCVGGVVCEAMSSRTTIVGPRHNAACEVQCGVACVVQCGVGWVVCAGCGVCSTREGRTYHTTCDVPLYTSPSPGVLFGAFPEGFTSLGTMSQPGCGPIDKSGRSSEYSITVQLVVRIQHFPHAIHHTPYTTSLHTSHTTHHTPLVFTRHTSLAAHAIHHLLHPPYHTPYLARMKRG
jgi:hypothetical protein